MAKKKELVIVTISSDKLDTNLVKSLKKQLQKQLKSKRVAVIGVGKEDKIEITTVRE